MRRAILALTLLLPITVAAAQQQDTLPEPTQNPDATYRAFRTKNIYTFLKLDTRTGQIWQVQWSTENDSRFTVVLNRPVLVEKGTPAHPAILKPGRFTLVPTENIYTFLLLDQQDGRTWQVQWGDPEHRLVTEIP